jgi:hypothetical protein
MSGASAHLASRLSSSQVPVSRLSNRRCVGIMSNRSFSSKHTLPPNPAWIEFERSDGDQNLWPQNTTKSVDREGHVNYMRVAPLDDPLCIKWRVESGKALANLMELPGKPTSLGDSLCFSISSHMTF